MSPKKSNNKTQDTDPVRLLSVFESGSLTVRINGSSFITIDAQSRSLGIDDEGVKECGLKLSKIVHSQTGEKGWRDLIKGSESIARELSEEGWVLNYHDKGSNIVTMGRGVSSLTGHVLVNPLKIPKILENL